MPSRVVQRKRSGQCADRSLLCPRWREDPGSWLSSRTGPSGTLYSRHNTRGASGDLMAQSLSQGQNGWPRTVAGNSSRGGVGREHHGPMIGRRRRLVCEDRSATCNQARRRRGRGTRCKGEVVSRDGAILKHRQVDNTEPCRPGPGRMDATGQEDRAVVWPWPGPAVDTEEDRIVLLPYFSQGPELP